MKITFYSNYLTHHQIPFCNEMYKLLGPDFNFVTTEPMENERKSMGWDIDNKYQYELRVYENEDNAKKALQLAVDSDVMIIGSAPEIYLKKRFKYTNKLTFRYSERIYKKGRWRAVSPRGLINRFKTYFRYINKPLYMLCASAYTAGDLALLGSYIGRCYKWGYFPEVKEYNVEELMQKKENATPKILWAGRFIKLKHTEDAIEAAKKLKDSGYKFTLDIIGNGELEGHLKGLANKYNLNDVITFIGSMKPEEVRGKMEKANIYLFTSDFNEGWGVVLNEAMNSGCAVVASHAIGSVPFLIKDGENGFIYKNGDINSLCEKVKALLDNKEFQVKLGINAYKTLTETWNARVAAERLLKLIEELTKNKKSDLFDDGICSKPK